MNKIHLSHEAQSDLEEIKRYITKELENPSAAVNTAKRIIQSIRILQTYAEAGTLLSAIADADDTYRYLVSRNYLIFYRVNEHDIYVDRILYGRRDYLRILLGDRTYPAAED